jgi:hypothetical protein
VVTVELLPDPQLEARVRRSWERLAAAGLPSLAAHAHPSNRPHVTVAVADAFPHLSPVLPRLPIPITLTGVLGFGGARGALVRPVVASMALLDLHAAVRDAGIGARPRRSPGAWLPHVGLALRMSPQQRGSALELLADTSDEHGALVAARSYDEVSRTVRSLQ